MERRIFKPSESAFSSSIDDMPQYLSLQATGVQIPFANTPGAVLTPQEVFQASETFKNGGSFQNRQWKELLELDKHGGSSSFMYYTPTSGCPGYSSMQYEQGVLNAALCSQQRLDQFGSQGVLAAMYGPSKRG